MNNATFDSFYQTLIEMGRVIGRAARTGSAAIATMSWPALAVCCVLLAFALTIIPMALFLFVMFMAIKLIFNTFAKRAEPGVLTPYTSHKQEQDHDKPL